MKTFAIILLITLAIAALGVGYVFNFVLPETPDVPDHEHVYGEWENRTPATCEEAGEDFRKCECGEEETRKVDALGHDYSSEVTAPTCTEAGYTTYTCSCGKSYVGDEVAATGHSYGEWATKTPATCTEAEVEYRACNCGAEETRTGDAATGHTAISIAAALTKTDAMKHDVLVAGDFAVTATCTCGAEYTVTDGITLENATLSVEGDNLVTVKLGELSSDVTVNAAKFVKVVNGAIVDDTYVNSGNNTTNYSERPELYIYNTSMYRVLFRFNFSDVLNSQYYADFGEEAIVKFTFTVTNGVDLTGLPVTFKSYLTSELRSSVDFSELTWKNYSNTYTLGWGSDEDPNNTVSLLAKEPVGNRATYADGKFVITVTMRELEGCIDENGNALFVLLTGQKDVKPFVASMENEEFDAPSVQVIFSEDHAHAYIEQVAEEKYFASANCEEKAKYYYSCSCGLAGTATFEHGEVIEHSFGEWETKTAANCLDAEVEVRKCACGKEETQDGDAALGHNMESKYDETNHWTKCSRCDETTEAVAHFGGTATETEQAVCEGCNQPYGGLATHECSFSEWTTETPATCEAAEVEVRKCECGKEERRDGDAALGHNMESKYDETNHWTKCSRCDEATEAVAHFGGEATIFAQAICEGCNQPYGEVEKILTDDTYVDSGSGNTNKAYATNANLRAQAGSVYRRTYLRLDLSDIYNKSEFAAYSETAKLKFTFTLTDNSAAIDSETKFTLCTFSVTDPATVSVDFSKLTWNSVKSTENGGTYPELAFNGGVKVMDGLTVADDAVVYDANTLTLTIKYSDIESYIDASTGYVFIGFSTNVGLRVYSLDAETPATRPVVEYIYN